MNMCENGVIRPMSPEEITELNRQQAEAPEPVPTPDDRIASSFAGKLKILHPIRPSIPHGVLGMDGMVFSVSDLIKSAVSPKLRCPRSR